MADKIGGGGYFDSIANAASNFIDEAADAVDGAAETAANVVTSGAEDIAEGAKGLVSDAAEFGDEAIDVGKSGYDALREAGATAEKKVSALKNEMSAGVDRAVKSLSEPLLLASDPAIVSERLQEFFEVPFETFLSGGLDPMVLGQDACDRIVGLGSDIADNTMRLVEEHSIDQVVTEVVDVIGSLKDLELSDVGISVDGAKSFLKEAVGDAVQLAEEAMEFKDTFDQIGQAGDRLLDVRSDYLSPLLINPLVGAPVNAATYVLGSVLRGIGDIDDVSRAIIENQEEALEIIELMDPNYVANQASLLEVGGEVSLNASVKGKVYAEAGGEGEAGGEISIKKSSKDPDVYEVSFGLNTKVGMGVGVAELDSGVEASVDLSLGGKVTIEIQGEDIGRMSQVLFASDFINTDTVAASMNEFDYKLLSIETAGGVGLSADADAVVAGLKAEGGLTETHTTSFDKDGNELVGLKYTFGGKSELHLGDTKVGVTATDEMTIEYLKDSMGNIPMFTGGIADPVLEVVVDTVGAEAMLKVTNSVEGSIEYLEPVGQNGEDVYKINVKHSANFNEGGIETSAFVELKGLGVLMKKDPGLDGVLRDVAMGRTSVEELEARIESIGVDPKEVVTARIQVEYTRADGVTIKTPIASASVRKKDPPMTLVSFTAVGNDSKDVSISTTAERFQSRFEEVSQEMQANLTKSKPKMAAMSAWQLSGMVRP